MWQFISTVVTWIWAKLPAPQRMPVTFAFFAFIGLGWCLYEAPKYVSKSYDQRWQANAAPMKQLHDEQIKDINHRIDTLSGNMGNLSANMKNVSDDTQIIKNCLLNKTCGQ